MNDLSSRFSRVIEVKGLKRVDVAKALHISNPSVSRICSGENNPSARTITLFCSVYNVNEQWLRTGEGEMFLPENNSALEALAAEYGLTPEETVLIRKYLELKPEIQQGILDYILSVAAAIEAEPELDIEAEVEAYRRELLAQKKAAAKSSASPTSDAG